MNTERVTAVTAWGIDFLGRAGYDVPTKRRKLPLFTWAYVIPDPPGDPVLTPICAAHPESKVFWTHYGDDITIVCKLGVEHVIGTCTIADFESEKAQAKAVLDR